MLKRTCTWTNSVWITGSNWRSWKKVNILLQTAKDAVIAMPKFKLYFQSGQISFREEQNRIHFSLLEKNWRSSHARQGKLKLLQDLCTIKLMSPFKTYAVYLLARPWLTSQSSKLQKDNPQLEPREKREPHIEDINKELKTNWRKLPFWGNYFWKRVTDCQFAGNISVK